MDISRSPKAIEATEESRAPSLSFDHILSRQYTVFDGLAGMKVEALHQDRRGFLWIATADGGLSRFDGVHFDNLGLEDGLPHLTVMAIAESPDGHLWFGTLGGSLAVYDGNEFRIYARKDGLPSEEVLNLSPAPDGSIWALTSSGAARFQDGECRECITEVGGQPLGRTYDVHTDSNGTTWLAGHYGVVSTQGEMLLPDDDSDFTWKFARDKTGHMWIAKRYQGAVPYLYKYNPQTKTLDKLIIPYDNSESTNTEQGIRHIRTDRRGWLWVSKQGILAYDGNQWHRLSLPSKATDCSSIRLSYEDREGNIWIGLWGGGLVFCDMLSTQRYKRQDGLPNREITGLTQDKAGDLWIGTRSGLAHRKNGHIVEEPFPPAFEQIKRSITAMARDADGAIWIATQDVGLFRWNGRSLDPMPILNDGGTVYLLYLDNAGKLWVGTTHDSFGWIENGHWFAVPLDPTINLYRMIQDRSGQFWIGSHGFTPAISRFDGQQCFPPDAEQLQNTSYVHALCETTDGTLWIGTTTGLFAYDHTNGTVRHFTTESGLSANAVTALVQDRYDTLWIGTSGGGGVRYNGEAFQVIRLGDTAQENMVTAILVEDQTRVWFGTHDGLVSYRPGSVRPQVYIRQVVAGNIYKDPKVITFTDDVPKIHISYQGIGFRSGGPQLRYRHRLTGIEQMGDWTNYTSASETTYDNLVPGQYRFEVVAMDRDSLVSEPASLDINITSSANVERINALQDVLRSSSQPLLGESAALQKTLGQVSMVAGTDMTVLILGETGTGKGLMSRTIHEMSLRKAKPFIQLNCGAIPEGLIESELFGHEKGAFTGAVSRKIGHFELANGGTLFLDEIGDLPLDSQRVLLHILEESELTRVGSGTPIPIDVRVVAATNRDLRESISNGTFREDLFFRLSVFALELPPLRHRQEDVPLLVQYFAEQFAHHLNRPCPQLAPGVMPFLQEYHWPGNVRELEHLIQRAVVVCQNNTIQIDNLPTLTSAPVPAPVPIQEKPTVEMPTESLTTEKKQDANWQFESIEDREKHQLQEALKAANWIIYGDRGAAKMLNMHPERLRSRMRKYGIKKPQKGKQAQ